jgi:hypothetical protein
MLSKKSPFCRWVPWIALLGETWSRFRLWRSLDPCLDSHAAGANWGVTGSRRRGLICRLRPRRKVARAAGVPDRMPLRLDPDQFERTGWEGYYHGKLTPSRRGFNIGTPRQSWLPIATASERWPGALSLAIIARLPLATTTRLGVMTTSAEDCWRLSGDCSRWAMESGDSAARLAFRQMATAWARLAFSEEFASPAADEHFDPTSSETSEPIQAENATSSPVVPPPTVSERGAADSNHPAEVDVGNYDHTTRANKTPDLSWRHKRLSLRSRIPFFKR